MVRLGHVGLQWGAAERSEVSWVVVGGVGWFGVVVVGGVWVGTACGTGFGIARKHGRNNMVVQDLRPAATAATRNELLCEYKKTIMGNIKKLTFLGGARGGLFASQLVFGTKHEKWCFEQENIRQTVWTSKQQKMMDEQKEKKRKLEDPVAEEQKEEDYYNANVSEKIEKKARFAEGAVPAHVEPTSRLRVVVVGLSSPKLGRHKKTRKPHKADVMVVGSLNSVDPAATLTCMCFGLRLCELPWLAGDVNAASVVYRKAALEFKLFLYVSRPFREKYPNAYKELKRACKQTGSQWTRLKNLSQYQKAQKQRVTMTRALVLPKAKMCEAWGDARGPITFGELVNLLKAESGVFQVRL